MNVAVLTPGSLDAVYDALGDEVERRLSADPRSADLSPVVARLLAVPPHRVVDPADAARFLHLLGFLSRQPGLDARAAWAWATAVAQSHSTSGDVLGLLAATGDGLNGSDPAAPIPTAELATLFRRSMAAAPGTATAFGRAGLFFLHHGDDAEAERCLARAFDLDPTSRFVAKQLADLFDHAGRPADGLAVLERCVAATATTHGADAVDPELLWAAGLAAVTLNPASAAEHFAQLGRLDPGRTWVAYYRSVALLDLGRFAEAATAIEREAGLIRLPAALHVSAVRAAAAAGLGDVDSVRRHVDAAVRAPLSSVDYLPAAGVVGCHTRLWAAARSLSADDTVVARLTERLLASGLTPGPFWDAARADEVRVDGLTHFWCDLRQPVDPTWAAAGHALPGSERWGAYRIRYGVLATDADDAGRRAVAWQRRSGTSEPSVESVTANGGGHADRPGVVQRGWPEAAVG